MREERKFVTALFADIVGSTALAEILDAEDAREIIGGAIERIALTVESFGGTVKDLAGDGLLALFGAPVAHEDDAERAVRAGLGICREVARYGAEVTSTWGIEGFDVRTGIESGVVVLGPVGAGRRVEYGATGDAVNTASRLQSHAEPGTVLVGRETRRLIETRFDWSEPRALSLKGKSEPVIAYRALGLREHPAPSPTSPPTPLVGRDEELVQVRSVVETIQRGRGCVLSLIGEPGMGKSRLLAETRARIHDVGGTWLEGRCHSFGGSTPYLPFQELLHAWLRLGAITPGTEIAERLALRLSDVLGEHAAELRPFVSSLLGATLTPTDEAVLVGLSPEARQFRTIEALAQIVSAVAMAGPLVVAVEDLHWADPSSIQVLSRLMHLAPGAGFLVAVTSREDEGASWSRLAEDLPRDVCTLVRLDTLPSGADRELLTSLTGEGVIPAALERRLLDAGAGNPFYLEELVGALVDAGALVRDDGRWRFENLVDFEVPTTIEKVIVARMDQLADHPRETLRAASVLGRRFAVDLLERIADQSTDVGRSVDELVRVGLIGWSEEGSRLAFEHALIQEVAYGTLLKRRRRELHARAAQALRALHRHALDDVLPVLAHHHLVAGEQEEALACFRAASAVALGVSALPEAVAHLDRALAVAAEMGLPEDDPSLAGDRSVRGRTRARIGDFAGAREDLELVSGLPSSPGLELIRLDALQELGFLLAGTGDYRDAEQILEEARTRAESVGADRLSAITLARLSIVRTNLLDLARARTDADQALRLARSAGAEDAVASALDAAELVAVMLADFDRVEDLAAELTVIHRRRGDLWFLQYALFQSSWGPLARCDWTTALMRLDEAEGVADRIGDRGPLALYAAVRCWLERSRGAYDRAFQHGRRAVELGDELGHTEWQTWSRGQLGRLLIEAGEMREAAAVLDEALEAAERSGAAIHRLRAAGLLATSRWGLGDREEAMSAATLALRLHDAVTAPTGTAYLQGADGILSVAEVLAEDEPERARALAEPLAEIAAASGWREVEAQAWLVLAICHQAHLDVEAALRALTLAVRTAGSDLPGIAWRAQARLHRMTGDPHAADEARRIAHGLRAMIPDASIRIGFDTAVHRELEGRAR